MQATIANFFPGGMGKAEKSGIFGKTQSLMEWPKKLSQKNEAARQRCKPVFSAVNADTYASLAMSAWLVAGDASC
jgi:hypothetical protein